MLSLIANIAGAVALLLWSVRLIRTGIERGFGGTLRTGLRQASRSPMTALFGGVLAAALMQSSTAVAMLVSGFSASGSLALTTGLTIVLGADLGSAFAARLLLLPVEAIVPFLLIGGVALFLRAASPAMKQLGRVLIGVALVLVSLSMMRAATLPLQGNDIVELLVSRLGSELFAAFLVGALIAWAMHSSVAAVLTFVTLTTNGLLGAPSAIALVLGANLGGALIPVWLTLRSSQPARQIMKANAIVRGGGALIAFGIVTRVDGLDRLGATASAQAINVHLLFNALVVVAAFPLIRPALSLAAKIVSTPAADEFGTERISALDDTTLKTPERALSSATREVLGMGEMVNQMLTPALNLLVDWNPSVADKIRKIETDVDSIHLNVKIFIARLQEGKLTPAQSTRAMDIASVANHFEDAGDQISATIVEIAQCMNADGLAFSEDGWCDLMEFHDQVMSNAQLGLNVLVTGDVETAIQLVEEKDRARETEQKLQARHLSRLRKGNAASLQTSNYHQEIIRALKNVNTAFTHVAYPIAKESGALLSSRLASS